MKEIERIEAGERVWAFDHTGLIWVERKVVETYIHQHNGTTAEIQVEGEKIWATGGHPFWVVDGEDLAGRPMLKHIETYELGSQQKGRWVLAEDLRAGDEVLLRSGSTKPLVSVRLEVTEEPVYNFRVADLSNYAVSGCGVLVHNENAKPSAPNGANNAASHAAYKRELAAQEAAQNPTRSLNDPLPANPKAPSQANPHAPDPAATGPHTVLGTRNNTKTSPTPYRQGITYSEAGNPVGRTDVTTHGRGDHPNPHYHPYDPNIDDFGPHAPFPF